MAVRALPPPLVIPVFLPTCLVPKASDDMHVQVLLTALTHVITFWAKSAVLAITPQLVRVAFPSLAHEA